MRTRTRDVFFDPCGRRWKAIRLSAVVLVFIIVLGAMVSWPAMQQPPALASGQTALPAVSVPDDVRAPDIGVGPLVRVARVVRNTTGATMVDPLTNRTVGSLTADDLAYIGSTDYVMQHYGYSSAAHKTIELTFDDGPDPTWTPMILDLLSKYKASATFFDIGAEIVKYPAIVQREAQEGHAIGNHTLTHPDLMPADVEQQFATTDRIIRAVTGRSTNLVRMPYDSAPAGVAYSDADTVVLDAERFNYIVSTEEFDTDDWKYGDPALRPKQPIPLPSTSMDNITVLLHDGGGNRAATVAYLKRILAWGRANGYSFHSLPQVSPQVMAGIGHAARNITNLETNWLYSALFAWPTAIIKILFLLAIISVVLGSGLNVALALARGALRRRKLNTYDSGAAPPVSIIIAAYNEEKVIARTLTSLGQSRYPNIPEIIVVDDGSTDGTADIVAEMARTEPRIRLMRQANTGKAEALNRAFRQARSSIVVTLDADTIVSPMTVSNLARQFANDRTGRLAVVAGVVKVGNMRNLLTRWQALEYITMIGVDRGAQDVLHAIMIAPGACAAWNRRAVLRVGGYSRSTLAEDCDLTLDLQQAGYIVTQDDDAICYTEAPETVRTLARQRYRWMYGNLQALWKHRRMVFNPRYGWLGMLTLPLAVVSIVLPLLFLPFIYVMAVVTFEGQGINLVLLYFGIFLLTQFVSVVAGVLLARESLSHLLMAPLYRLIYEPLRAYTLYRSTLNALRGTRSSWNKLQRTGAVSLPVADATPEPVKGLA